MRNNIISMTKCATTVISVDKNNQANFGILAIKGHESSEEARLYVFDEILRMIDDISEDSKVIVESYRDEYGELCLSVTANDNETVVIKTLFEEETNND